MITINLQQKTQENGHLILDVPTTFIDKNVEVVLVIHEKEDVVEISGKKKFDFSDLYGKLEWKGDAIAEQKKIRSEWK